jgi:hypothetical protein
MFLFLFLHRTLHPSFILSGTQGKLCSFFCPLYFSYVLFFLALQLSFFASRLSPLPPSLPPSLQPGLGIHGVVTYFVVDKLGGNFKLLVDQYILKLVPKPIMEKVEAKLK